MKKIINNKGYVALITVLMIGAVGLSIAVSLLLLSIGTSKTSYSIEVSAEARVYADACINDALEKIRKNQSFVGTKTLSFDYGECSYEVIDNGGGARTINSVGSSNTAIRKAQAILDAVNPKPNIVSFQELEDF